MGSYSVAIFGAGNVTNPQNPGHLPSEDGTYMSDLVNGDTLTWVGGDESTVVTISDSTDSLFDEAQWDQTLASPVTFDGVSYETGQVVSPSFVVLLSGSDGNNYTMTSFNFSGNGGPPEADAIFWEGLIPPPGTVLTVTGESNPTGAQSRDYNILATCFCGGSEISTELGERPVERLEVGDMIWTSRGDLKPILWIGRREVSMAELMVYPNLRPIRITAGAMGNNLPRKDLLVSPQHRMVVSSKIAQRMFGKSEVLVAAVKLLSVPSVYIDKRLKPVSYFHMLFEAHEIVFAEGAATESLYSGPMALKSMKPELRKEMEFLFPELSERDHSAKPACYIPVGSQQKKLVTRHVKNNKPLFALKRANGPN